MPLENGTSAFGFAAIKLDLNNDGVVDVRDNDGWRYHQGLPFETRLKRHLLNADAAPYYAQPPRSRAMYSCTAQGGAFEIRGVGLRLGAAWHGRLPAWVRRH